MYKNMANVNVNAKLFLPSMRRSSNTELQEPRRLFLILKWNYVKKIESKVTHLAGQMGKKYSFNQNPRHPLNSCTLEATSGSVWGKPKNNKKLRNIFATRMKTILRTSAVGLPQCSCVITVLYVKLSLLVLLYPIRKSLFIYEEFCLSEEHAGFEVFGVSLQLMSARWGLVHTVTFLQQLEQLLHWDSGIWRAPQGEDLPKQNPKWPAADRNGRERLHFLHN